MYFTNICWHEFAKEKPEKEGRYLVFVKELKDYYIYDIKWSHTLEYFEEIGDEKEVFHFMQDFYEFGEYAGEIVIDEQVVLWAELESMEEELKSYIVKEETK